jgi:hypothetical protein
MRFGKRTYGYTTASLYMNFISVPGYRYLVASCLNTLVSVAEPAENRTGATMVRRSDTDSAFTVHTLKFVYYLDSEKATLRSIYQTILAY